jgi:hypothetical protein
VCFKVKKIFYHPYKVKNLLMLENQQVTKKYHILIGTSETTRSLSSKNLKLNNNTNDKA